MTTTKKDNVQMHIDEICGAAQEIARNAELIRQEPGRKPGWNSYGRDEREKILMELRHDLADALRHVEFLESQQNLDDIGRDLAEPLPTKRGQLQKDKSTHIK